MSDWPPGWATVEGSWPEMVDGVPMIRTSVRFADGTREEWLTDMEPLDLDDLE